MGTRFRLRLDPQLATDPARLSQKFKPLPANNIVCQISLVPPSVQAVSHYPVQAIVPFPDLQSRTGRIYVAALPRI